MDAKLYQCLINGFPAAWWQVLDEASALLRSRLETHASPTLGDLVRLFPLPTGSWVRLPDGTVHQIGPDGMPAPGSSFEVTPTNRLTGSEPGLYAGCFPASPATRCAKYLFGGKFGPPTMRMTLRKKSDVCRGGDVVVPTLTLFMAAQSSCLAY